MSASIILPLIMGLILLRIFWLRAKAAGTRTDNFKQLPQKDQLAVLKECLLNNPSEINLRNLEKFASESGIDLEAESYRPFMKLQQELRNKKNALEEDNQLYNQEAEWLDNIKPFEFQEAETAKESGDTTDYITKSLEGIARLYSDQAILDNLNKLTPCYPKSESLIQSYRELMELRDNSAADDESLQQLRKAKESWDNELLNYEP